LPVFIGEAPVTAHPGKTPAQRRFLDEIGCGNYSPIADKRTIAALLKQGLIEELTPLQVPLFGSVCMTVRQFQMPLHIHLEWCCSCEDEEPPAQGIEAGTATTGTGVVHESPVLEEDAPND
jgi:hypothetical protein